MGGVRKNWNLLWNLSQVPPIKMDALRGRCSKSHRFWRNLRQLLHVLAFGNRANCVGGVRESWILRWILSQVPKQKCTFCVGEVAKATGTGGTFDRALPWSYLRKSQIMGEVCESRCQVPKLGTKFRYEK